MTMIAPTRGRLGAAMVKVEGPARASALQWLTGKDPGWGRRTLSKRNGERIATPEGVHGAGSAGFLGLELSHSGVGGWLVIVGKLTPGQLVAGREHREVRTVAKCRRVYSVFVSSIQPASVTSARIPVTERSARLAKTLQTFAAAFAALPGVLLWSVTVASHPGGGGPPSYLGGLIALLWAGPMIWLAGRLAGRQRSVGDVIADVEGTTLLLQSASGQYRRIAATDITSAIVDAADTLHLELRDGKELSLALGNERANKLLGTLGLEPGKRRAAFRWHRRRDAFFGAVAGLLLPILIFLLSPTPPVATLMLPIVSGIPWLLAAWFAEFFSKRSVTIGSDGIEVCRRGRTRRLRFNDIRDMKTSFANVDIFLNDGRVERILTDDKMEKGGNAIGRWIEQAARRMHETPRRPIDLPSRAGGSFEQFRNSAARTLKASVGFRNAEVTGEDVASVLEAPSSPSDERIAAAIALASRGKPDDMARIRVAAEASVNPKLRIALEAVAADTLAEEMVEAAEAEMRRR